MSSSDVIFRVFIVVFEREEGVGWVVEGMIESSPHTGILAKERHPSSKVLSVDDVAVPVLVTVVAVLLRFSTMRYCC